MNKKQKQQVFPERRRPLRSLALAALLAGVSGLSGCSSVPDALNPAEWYNSTVDFFAGEDDEGQVADKNLPEEMKKNPGEGKAFPNLASVPDRPKRTVKGGLVADTQGRKYAQAIPRQGESASTLTASRTAPTQPPPPAMPVPQVIPVQPPLSAAPAPAPTSAPMFAAPAMPPPMTTPEPQMAALTPPPGMPANAVIDMGDDPFATVVVSADGVEMMGAAKTTAPMSQLPVATELKTALQLPSGPASGGERVATILFANGSYALTGRDRQILGEIVRLQRKRGGKIRVVGHASSRTRNMDPVRHKMVNYKVSVDRAEIIGKQLMRLGIASADVYVDARSDTMPLYYESMPSGEAGNRRAEIYLEN